MYGKSHDRPLTHANGATAGDNANIHTAGPGDLARLWDIWLIAQ
ncbi:hypothetical protein [Burkholderia sp. AU30280]|nr:hypothetical protein [Burkholderia sp. AU30280]